MRQNPNRFINIFEKVRRGLGALKAWGAGCRPHPSPYIPSTRPQSPPPPFPLPPPPFPLPPTKQTKPTQDLYNPARIYAQSFSEKGASPKLSQLLGAITTVEECINRIERVAKGACVWDDGLAWVDCLIGAGRPVELCVMR